jgi:16S rRNA processing protein RimM
LGNTAVNVVVARLGRARGLAGELALELHTDAPGARLAPGAVFLTDPPAVGPLTLVRARQEPKGWFARFEEIRDRTAAEAARGAELLIPAAAAEEPDAWYPHELKGLRVELPDGRVAGTCAGVEHLPAQDLVRVREPGGGVALVPFVRALVPVVDVAGGRIVVDPPAGLLAVRPLPEADDTDADTADAASAADAEGAGRA